MVTLNNIKIIMASHLAQMAWMEGYVIPSKRPSRKRTPMRKPVPRCVHSGVTTVSADVAAIPVRKIRLPPYRVACNAGILQVQAQHNKININNRKGLRIGQQTCCMEIKRN